MDVAATTSYSSSDLQSICLQLASYLSTIIRCKWHQFQQKRSITFSLFYHDVLVSCLVILSIRNVVSMSEIIDLPMYQWLMAAGWSPTTPITTICYSYYYSTTILSSTPLYSSPLLSSFCYFYYYSTTFLILLFTTSTSVFYQLLLLVAAGWSPTTPITTTCYSYYYSTTILSPCSSPTTLPLLFYYYSPLLHSTPPLSSIFATFPILYVWEATAAFLHLFLSMFVKQLLLFCQISPLLSSSLFCR